MADQATLDGESLYRAVFEHMSEGVALCRMLFDKAGRPHDFEYLRVNAAFEKLTGLMNVTGRKVSDVIPGILESSPELIETYGRVATTGRPEKFETYVKGLDSWFSIAAYRPVPDHFVAVFTVITQRKNAETALELFRALIDRSRDGIEVVDPETGRYLDVNEKACLDSGYTREEFLALSVRDLDPTVDARAFKKAQAELRKTGALMWQGVRRRKDGSLFPVEVSVANVQIDRTFQVAVVRDISDRMRSEAQMRLQAAALNAAANAIVITDRSGSIAWVNPAFTDLTGYGIGEALGRNPRELVKSG
ncbi:MAG: PAS domain S-box protein, partial [Gemmatimonadales bacterium]